MNLKDTTNSCVISELMEEHSFKMLLKITKIPRSNFYYYLKQMSCDDKYSDVKMQIKDIFSDHKGRYGYCGVTAALQGLGVLINHKTVYHRLMSELKLKSLVRVKKYRSYKGDVGRIAPNILERNFVATALIRSWRQILPSFLCLGKIIFVSDN